MSKYSLHHKGSDEIISKFETQSSTSLRYKVDEKEIAIKYFSTIKQLPKEEFLRIFEVKEIK